jgi:pimeloyl-ACP methyl ester carboxylesterase
MLESTCAGQSRSPAASASACTRCKILPRSRPPPTGRSGGSRSSTEHRVVTYDRRGFGESDKPLLGYGFDNLADDLPALLVTLDLRDVTLVGFSMGGGEVARYVSRHGQERLHSVVFAAAVTPYLMRGSDNPDGPLTKAEAARMTGQLTRRKIRSMTTGVAPRSWTLETGILMVLVDQESWKLWRTSTIHSNSRPMRSPCTGLGRGRRSR